MKRLTAEWVSKAEADYQGAVTLQRHKNQSNWGPFASALSYNATSE